MNDVNERKLAEQLDRELKGLPHLKAPASLGPRVLAAIRARRAAPWWKKSWDAWPAGMKLAFLVAGVAAVGGLVFAGTAVPQFGTLTSGLMEWGGGMFTALQPYYQVIERLAGGLALAIRAAGPHLYWYLAALGGVAYGTCVGLGTVGYRLVFHRI